jgi:nicotinamide-nucleotide amidase
VVYSNKAKEEILNVSADIINKYGAVSEPVAKLMAEGVRKVSNTAFGLAVTGIAGPSGGTAEKPVGTVYIAVSSEEKTEVRKHGFFFNDRERIKLMTSHMALEYLRRAVLGMSIQ